MCRRHCIDCPLAPISQPPPAVVNNISIYLNDFDEDETQVVQLYSPVPCNLDFPVLGWTPPDGSEDVEIDQENLIYPSQVSNPALHRVRRAYDNPEHLTVYQTARRRAKHPPRQLPRTRVVLGPTQSIDTTSMMTHNRAPLRLSCGPPKGGIPPGLALDVTKFHALRTQQESNRRQAAVARAKEGRKASVLQRANVQTDVGMMLSKLVDVVDVHS